VTGSTKRRSNSSATGSSTSKRLAARQLWPRLRNRDRAACLATAARSASARITALGFLRLLEVRQSSGTYFRGPDQELLFRLFE
jgi:hypothetical protein